MNTQNNSARQPGRSARLAASETKRAYARGATASSSRATAPAASRNRASAPAASRGRASAPRHGSRRSTDAAKRYRLIKWALLALLVGYTALVVSANAARDVDFSAIQARMAQAPGIDALEALDENAFLERFGASPEGCEGWLLYGSSEIMNVSELMIAKAGDEARDRLEEAARQRVDDQLGVFRNYGVEQAGLLDGAALWQRGAYLFYGVGEQLDQWEDLFLSCIR